MAIIYSYPDKSSPSGSDVLVITDSQQTAPNKNRTKSLTLDNLASYVVSSTSGITGSGTLNTIAMFTPDGQKIGDSFIKQQVIAATNVVRIDGGGGFLNKFQSDEIQTSSLLTDNITADGTGNVILKGGVIIGDQSTDILQITSKVSDSTGTGSTAAGEVLISNAAGQLVWGSNSTYSWNITGDNGTSSTVASGNTVDIAGGTNITTAADLTDTVTINLDDSITLAGTLTVNGDTVIGDAGTDTLTVNAETTFADNVTINGNLKSLKMGVTSPLIFVDGGGTTRLTIGGNITGNSIINESGSGDLILVSNTEVEIKSGELGENFAKFTKDGPIELYYDNVKKFETSSNSIKILDVPVHADNAAASAAGLTVGEVYRTGDLLKIVH